MFSRQTKRSTRLSYATDGHGSGRTLHKIIVVGKSHQATALMMGGDIVGKMMIPILCEAARHQR